MSRHLVAAAAQLGPIHRADSRESVVRRLVDLMRQAADRGCRLVVYPELALTTFFPRWLYDSQDEVDTWFEHVMPNAATRPLFDEAKRLGIGFHLGYAELCEEDGATRRFNTAILVGPDGNIVGKCRKINPPGTAEPVPDAPFQHLEKRYFEVGNLGFRTRRCRSFPPSSGVAGSRWYRARGRGRGRRAAPATHGRERPCRRAPAGRSRARARRRSRPPDHGVR